MRTASTILAAWMALSLAGSALAQSPLRQTQGGVAPGAGMQGPARAQLEEDIRRGFARAVRMRVGLSDDQMQRLGPLTRRYEEQRRRLQLEERDARMSLQTVIRDETAPDSVKIEQLLQRLLDVQRRRVQLAESEQGELAAIMTPIQRAKYLALQEQVRRRLEQMRAPPRGPMDGDLPGPAGRRGRPPQRPQR